MTPKGPPVNKKVALAVSGGIAAYKAAEILRGLQKAGCTVRVAMTRRACEFVQPLTFRALSGVHVVVDDYAPDNPDPIAHITFSQTVDLFLVAPATANLIGKFANGIADDFVSSTYLAATSPVLIAPSMNTTMWEHPATRRNLAKLKADGVHFVEPDHGEMACGTFGPGRLSDPDVVVAAALEILRANQIGQDLVAEHLLITAGATREPLDPVRFLSNRSSGRMGFAIAEAARARGAQVTIVAGYTTVPVPEDVTLVSVSSAEEMHQAVLQKLPEASVVIASAAVADYRPAVRSKQKMKKSQTSLMIELERTPDILREVSAARRDGQLVIGFAAESENVLLNAKQKLEMKQLDAIVANDITRQGAGFDSETNEVTILSRGRKAPIHVPLMPKVNVANIILDEVVRLRARANTSVHNVRRPRKA